MGSIHIRLSQSSAVVNEAPPLTAPGIDGIPGEFPRMGRKDKRGSEISGKLEKRALSANYIFSTTTLRPRAGKNPVLG